MNKYQRAIIVFVLCILMIWLHPGKVALGVAIFAILCIAGDMLRSRAQETKVSGVGNACDGLVDAGYGWTITPADKNSVYVYLHGKPAGLLRRTEIQFGLSHNTPGAPDYQETNQLLSTAMKLLNDYNKPGCRCRKE